MRTASVLTLIALLALTGCSAVPTSSTSGGGTTSVATTSTTSSPAPSSAGIGQTVSNRGITITVTEARAVNSVLMNESDHRSGSGYVPQAATVIGWGFQDTTGFSGTTNFTTVRFDA
ncbi:hypothetical protein [Lentzea fradiae]|uniref:hypothetical protein n=1 Tax=Lentzea fradiae TaxID=200378 RepID=UPI000B7D5E4F|nr:hypothetical protein [Lentzea fradiae]